MKRAVDVGVVVLTMWLWAPLMVLVGLLVRLRLGAPVLFRQERVGEHGRRFVLVKFRTMTNARDTNGRLLSDQDRLTPLGRWLRMTSLDELPELFNVLRGDMSLVGPRPLLPEYSPLYSPEQRRRHEVRPGITGWAQVNGRNAQTWEERLTMDVWYVDNRSLRLDAAILAKTAIRVITRSGISAEGEATMKAFAGTDPGAG